MWSPSSNGQRRLSQTLLRARAQPRAKGKTIKDHNGDDVQIAWMIHPLYEGYAEKFPPFPFQVYVLKSATATANDREFPAKFVKWIEEIGGIADAGARCHFEFYINNFKNTLSCVAHQRAEILHRNRNALWPRLVTSWAQTHDLNDYRGFIMIIDCDMWVRDGLTFVSFDRQMLDRDKPTVAYSGMPLGCEVDMFASRHRANTTSVGGMLMHAWTNAGNTWTQNDLARRNQGGFSPALYPAVDPAAHHDADADQEDLGFGGLNLTPAESSSQIQEPTDANQELPMHVFDKRNLWKSASDLVHLKSEDYEDTVEWPTTSVWKASKSPARPDFAFTLYLSADLPPFTPKALFHCLDRGLLKEAVWTLDVVHHMPDLQSAFHHYCIDTPRRTVAKTERRRQCAGMLLDKICGNCLPEELLQYIESWIVPPPCCNYDSPPHRPLPGMFLFLDASRQLVGPQLIHTVLHERSGAADVANIALHRETASDHPSLVLIDLQLWHLVADELHTIWSLCSPRCELAHVDTPFFTLDFEFPKVCTVDPAYGGLMHPMPDATATWALHSRTPITIHKVHYFQPDLWDEALEISDTLTGEPFPTIPPTSLPVGYRKLSSWSQDPRVAYTNPDDPGDTVLVTYQPGVKVAQKMHSPRAWWTERVKRGLFEDGKEYVVKGKRGMKIPRWTFGSLREGQLKGPFNLPPMPVKVRSEGRFLFRLGIPDD